MCEICGRLNCTRSFHSLEEQREFDNTADDIKDRMRQVLIDRVKRLLDRGTDDSEVLVSLKEVIEIIQDY